MRFIILLLFPLISTAQELNVMSFNIRLNIASDSLNAWPYRKDKVSSQIIYHDVHILGVQEALHDQMVDLQSALKKFKYVGVARDDGKQKGEYSAIFYDTTRLKVIHHETFWLSETPGVAGSKSWDAAITRVVTYARFRDKISKKTFYVFNTHFDHIGKVARLNSARLIRSTSEKIAGRIPIILMGDLNSIPSDDPVKFLTDSTSSFHFTDAKHVSTTPHYGPTGTFNGFRSKEVHDDPIDYIFIRGRIKVLKHATLSQTWGGRFASDHFAVLATLKIEE